MSLNSYNPNTRYRYRSKRRKRGFFWGSIIAIIFIYTGYSMGLFKAKEIEITENMTLEELRKENLMLKNKFTEISSEYQIAITKYNQLEGLYNKELPEEGPLRDLVSLLKIQIDNGVNPERLKFAIRSARPPTNCESPKTDRFVVSTPAYTGVKSQIIIGSGDVTDKAHIILSGNGVSAKNSKSKDEAWFDPAKSVEISFIDIDGKESFKKRVLPFQHSVVSAGREYRFSFEAGAKSFIRVTYDSCDYP